MSKAYPARSFTRVSAFNPLTLVRNHSAELQSSRAKSLGVDPNEEEIEEARRSVAKLRRGFDGLKESRKRKEKEYDELKWQNHDLELEAQRPNEGDSPFSRKIRMLEAHCGFLRFWYCQLVFFVQCAQVLLSFHERACKALA